MLINYSQILKKNMLNVLKDVLKKVEKNGLLGGHYLYVTYKTNAKNVTIPAWLKKKYPEEMTIVIQYEFWNLKVLEDRFEILLSFNNAKIDLSIPYKSVISFADPFANFGLKLNNDIVYSELKKNKDIKNKKNNIVNFNEFKKLR